MTKCYICGKEVEETEQMLKDFVLCDWHNLQIYNYIKISKEIISKNGVKK